MLIPDEFNFERWKSSGRDSLPLLCYRCLMVVPSSKIIRWLRIRMLTNASIARTSLPSPSLSLLRYPKAKPRGNHHFLSKWHRQQTQILSPKSSQPAQPYEATAPMQPLSSKTKTPPSTANSNISVPANFCVNRASCTHSTYNRKSRKKPTQRTMKTKAGQDQPYYCNPSTPQASEHQGFAGANQAEE